MRRNSEYRVTGDKAFSRIEDREDENPSESEQEIGKKTPEISDDKAFFCIEDWDDEHPSESEQEIGRNITEVSGDSMAPVSLELCYKKLLDADDKIFAYFDEADSNSSDFESSVTDYSLSSTDKSTDAFSQNYLYDDKFGVVKKQTTQRFLNIRKCFAGSVFLFIFVSVALCSVLLICAEHHLRYEHLNNILGVAYIVVSAYVLYSSLLIIIYRRVAETMLDKLRVCRPLFEAFMRIIIISYTFRILCETYINDSDHFIVTFDKWKGLALVWMFFIVLGAIILSLNADQISFLSVLQHFALMILVIDRMLYNPFITKSAERLYRLLVLEPMLLLERRSTYFLNDKLVSFFLSRYIIQLMITGMSASLTNYFGFFLCFGVSRNRTLRIGSNIVVAVIQIISIIFSPVLGLVLSTAVISELNYAQIVSIMAGLLISPSICLNPSIVTTIPMREVLLMNLVTIFAIQGMCGIASPTASAKEVQLILRDDAPTYLFDMPWKGIRCGMHFLRKAISYLIVNYIVFSLMRDAADTILSYICCSLSNNLNEKFLEDILALHLYPLLKLTGISWNYVAGIAKVYSMKLLTGMELSSYMNYGINSILLRNCIKTGEKYIVVIGAKYHEFFMHTKYRGYKLFKFFSGETYNADSSFIFMFIAYNSISLKDVVLFYTTYFVFVRSMANTIFYAMLRGAMIAFITNLLVATLIGFYQPKGKRLECHKVDLKPHAVCQLLIQHSNFSTNDISTFSLCERVRGNLIFKYRSAEP